MSQATGARLQSKRIREGTGKSSRRVRLRGAPGWALFGLACAATLAIAAPGRYVNAGFEIGIFAVAVVAAWRGISWREIGWSTAAAGAIGAWGFGQLLAGATVYRWASWQASLQFAALGATWFVARAAFGDPSRLHGLLRAVTGFGAAVGVVGVLAYYTSPGKILWVFPAAYPDNWGPFPSRDNFAQFLELCLPVALWRAGRSSGWGAMLAPAAILAAGLASASRAGAALLLVESAAAIVMLRKKTRRWLPFVGAAALFAGLAGVGTLWGRLGDRDPLQYRREIYGSAVEMIRAHPWKGYGLGAFAAVYPEFATFDSGAAVDHAHSDWLEWAAEGGLPFAGLWLALAISLAPRAVRSVWGLGVLAIFLHAAVDYPFARFGVSAWVFLFCGALFSSREKFRPSPTNAL